MDSFIQDARWALRALAKTPGLTAIVALTIAIGIGVNTATFSVVNGFLIRPLPLPSPEQLMVLAIDDKNAPIGALGFSYPEFSEFRQQAAAQCEILGQAFPGPLGLSADGHTDQVSLVAVSSNYFSGLGVNLGLGRLILPGDRETAGQPAVLVLGYSYWRKRFGGDPGIIGKQVRIDGKLVEVIGVVPKEFRGPFSIFELDGYMPFSTVFPGGTAISFWTDRNAHKIAAIARLKPGTDRAGLQNLMDVIARRQAEQFPASDQGISVHVIPEKMARPVAYANTAFLVISSLFLVLSLVVLLLACTNVANILMARASSRMREMAIRTSLGASRRRLLQQVLTETLLIMTGGGVLGVLLGLGISRMAGSPVHLQNFPLHLDTAFDWRMFAFALAVVSITAISVGLSVALNVTRVDVNAVLQPGSRKADKSGYRARKDLMALQVAGSLTLLIVAGLFVRSLQAAQNLDLGFNPDHLLNVALNPHQNNYNQAQTDQFFRELETNVRAMPGVESASLASSVPISTFPSRERIYAEGQPALVDRAQPEILFNRVDPGYFKTMGIPLLLGRQFLDSDDEAAQPVAVINNAMASRLWPGQNPIGKRFSMKEPAGRLVEVVGVAHDSKYQTIAEDPQPYFYVPIAQSYAALRILQVRSSLAAASLANQIQQEIRRLDPGMTAIDIQTMRESLAGATGFFIFRLGSSIAAFIGVLGTALAIVGVYGMVSYATAQRTQEIGIRIALGANRAQILKLIVDQGMKTVLLGMAFGLAAALGLTRLMKHLLVGVSPSDPVVYLGVSLLLSSIALFACYLPARRAANVDPMVALRYE